MRLCSDMFSPNFNLELVARTLVRVDGVAVASVLEADTEEGWADIAARNDKGVLIEAPPVRLTGVVTFETLTDEQIEQRADEEVAFL